MVHPHIQIVDVGAVPGQTSREVLNLAEDIVTIEIDAKDLMKALNQAPREIERALKRAGLEAARNVVNTRGLKSYPSATSANSPPFPYYIRGRGTQYKSGKNDGKSERYGTMWNVKYGEMNKSVTLGNRASYAQYLASEKGKTGDIGQARAMGKIGWRKLTDVVQEKLGKIKAIYDGWIQEALRRAGLK